MPLRRPSDAEPDLHLSPSLPFSLKPAMNSPIERLLSIFRLRESGRPSGNGDWRVFTLSPAQFVELQGRIAADDELFGYFDDKVRYDYDPSKGEFILRTPERIHQHFISLVEREIWDAIQRLASDWDDRHEQHAAKALRDIFGARSTTLELHQPRLENSSQSSFSSSEDITVLRSPDATFFHYQNTALPALVVEVSYSHQGKKKLGRLAESYIVDSAHRIKCVVGLDIPYPSKSKDRSARISIWRPGVEVDEDGEEVGFCQCDVDALLFQTPEGDACDGDMELTVTDILPTSVLDTLSTSLHVETITIPFLRLREFLHDAGTEPVAQPEKSQRRYRKRKMSEE